MESGANSLLQFFQSPLLCVMTKANDDLDTATSRGIIGGAEYRPLPRTRALLASASGVAIRSYSACFPAELSRWTKEAFA